MYNQTVTVFNRYESKQLDTYTWYPHVLHGVNLMVDKAANQAKTGLENADTATLNVKYQIIDGKKMIQGLQYLPPKEWDLQTNDMLPQTITFTDGEDFFMQGEYDEFPVDDDSYREGFFSYINKKYDNVFRIKNVGGPYTVLPHFEIGGA